MNIISILQGENIVLKKINDSEYAGACLKCGGIDRFRVWPKEGTNGRWFCRGCNKSGDAIEFLRYYLNKSFVAACKTLNETDKLLINHFSAKNHSTCAWEAKKIEEPKTSWQEKALSFVEFSQRKLLNNSQVLLWLKNERGITLETIEKFKLGWNPTAIFCDRNSWGLSSETNEKGNPKKIWLPHGLVIPVFREKKLFRLKIRQDKIKTGDDRYIFVTGGSNIPLIAGKGNVAMIVESELDAILLSQFSTKIICVALGSCSNRPDIETFNILRKCAGILLSHDSDHAGAKEAFSWWKKNLPEAIRWPVPEKFGKDPSEAWKNNFPLQSWANLGVEKITGIKEEINENKSFFCKGDEDKERASIIEYDANFSRAKAEEKAGSA